MACRRRKDGSPPISSADMEPITSRQNKLIRHLRRLSRERAYRREQGAFVCDGLKLLDEAVHNDARIGLVLLREGGARPDPAVLGDTPVYLAGEEVFSYVSPLENSPGPLFTVSFPAPGEETPDRVMVLENIQDPGNVGTVLRTAAAMGCELVILTGKCADPYNPKTVRAAMGALFREPLAELSLAETKEKLSRWGLPLYGAALSPDAADVRSLRLDRAAVAVGNEGHGLSAELLDLCEKKIIIPMTPGSESLNAAVAASILMWEMARGEQAL